MIKLLRVKEEIKGGKRYVAEFDVDKKMKIVRFGDANAENYTIHKDKDRRTAYIKRHLKDLSTGDPMKAGFLSNVITWGASTLLKQNIQDYKRMLREYNENGRTSQFKEYMEALIN